jgi:hypothetical protein
LTRGEVGIVPIYSDMDYQGDLVNGGNHDDAMNTQGDVGGQEDAMGVNDNTIGHPLEGIMHSAAIEDYKQHPGGPFSAVKRRASGAPPNGAPQNNSGTPHEEGGGELMDLNSACLARGKPVPETDMLLDEQNGNTVEAFTAASRTGVYVEPLVFNEHGGDELLGGELVPFYVGDRKLADWLLNMENLEQVDVSGAEERVDAHSEPAPHYRGFMDRLRRGGLPLVGQEGCEVHAKTPLRGAGTKEER